MPTYNTNGSARSSRRRSSSRLIGLWRVLGRVDVQGHVVNHVASEAVRADQVRAAELADRQHPRRPSDLTAHDRAETQASRPRKGITQMFEAEIGHHQCHRHATATGRVSERHQHLGSRHQAADPAGQVPEKVAWAARPGLDGRPDVRRGTVDVRLDACGKQQVDLVVGPGAPHQRAHQGPRHRLVAAQAGADRAGIERHPHRTGVPAWTRRIDRSAGATGRRRRDRSCPTMLDLATPIDPTARRSRRTASCHRGSPIPSRPEYGCGAWRSS